MTELETLVTPLRNYPEKMLPILGLIFPSFNGTTVDITEDLKVSALLYAILERMGYATTTATFAVRFAHPHILKMVEAANKEGGYSAIRVPLILQIIDGVYAAVSSEPDRLFDLNSRTDVVYTAEVPTLSIALNLTKLFKPALLP